MCACNLVLPTYYEATHSRGSRQVDCKCNEIVTIRYDTIEEFNVDWKAEYSALSSTDIVLSHYPRKMICAVLDV